ncbi:uncharacterized protein LOC131946841 isoform X2 [Physella acuta]|uniref:uncharacterized protein LOC131946841 isoform X1 n=1 Tax=Physella acuta TaxID=109671 RepID=UPI0027DC5FDD|nr:uncharacterized protein LOC131946841 isoform X1 [Physella acuta]XP_059163805.1 uncharacterized protein LOC131946841 isoform X2 [Physella acuta]
MRNTVVYLLLALWFICSADVASAADFNIEIVGYSKPCVGCKDPWKILGVFESNAKISGNKCYQLFVDRCTNGNCMSNKTWEKMCELQTFPCARVQCPLKTNPVKRGERTEYVCECFGDNPRLYIFPAFPALAFRLRLATSPNPDEEAAIMAMSNFFYTKV